MTTMTTTGGVGGGVTVGAPEGEGQGVGAEAAGGGIGRSRLAGHAPTLSRAGETTGGTRGPDTDQGVVRER